MVVYLLCYAAAYLLTGMEYFYLSGICLMAAAAYLYFKDFSRGGNFLHLRGIFSLFWVGGQGLACLKLSRLSGKWGAMTWLCFLSAFIGFYVVFEILSSNMGDVSRADGRWKNFCGMEQSVFLCACAITVISLVCFLTEAAVLGYIPLFVKGVPHAYSYFHLTGIHYFTVSCVLVPALSVVWFTLDRGRDPEKKIMMLCADAVAFLIPVLCVSRFQVIMSMLLAVITYLLIDGRDKLIYVAGGAAVLIPLYLVLTVARSHDVTYLNGIFEMKNSNTPIFVTQPYMYVANNYENFNRLVEELPSHSMGLRMMTPLWTLSGLKFIFPSLMNFPIFTTKEELTTLTMFYDAYYDFGIIGVTLFSGLLGAVSYGLMRMVNKIRNPVGYVLYAQIALYLVLSFFTTWFSNPTTWFYLAITAVVAYVTEQKWGIRARRRKLRW